MYLSNLKLWNFRKFGSDAALRMDTPNLDLSFNPCLNVLIGENDSGKSAIIDSIRHVLKTHSYDWIRVDGDDFHFGQHRLRIELTLRGIEPDEGKNFTEFLSWEQAGEAVFPTLRLILDIQRNPISNQVQPYEVRAGADADGRALSPEAKEYLKVTYLKPLRDAKEELIARKNSRLSQILIGHEAFKGRGDDHRLIKHLKEFNGSIENYFDGKDSDGNEIEDQRGKDLKSGIDTYIRSLYEPSKNIGLAVTERGQLKSLLEKLELSIQGEVGPGLGTLNRLFMASELLHLNKKNWAGIRLGLVEELEAHLHPQAQMQAIDTFQNQRSVQLILTTHSPNIGSKLELKNLIICHGTNAFPLGEQYTQLDDGDYAFLQRFLDVTKANLFFAKGLVLVEGWSEEIILPELARLAGYNLTEKGVAIINVQSLAFTRYANIFKRKSEPHFKKPVAVVTDVDIPIDEEDGTAPGDKAKLIEARKAKADNFDGQCVRSFIAPRWTLEYCLSRSVVFKAKFAEITKAVHSRTDWSDFDGTLAGKLKDRSLAKTEIASRLAQAMADKEIDGAKLAEDESVDYLLKAIGYACGN